MAFDLNGGASGEDAAFSYRIGNLATSVAPDTVVANLVSDFRGGSLSFSLVDGRAGDFFTLVAQGGITVVRLSDTNGEVRFNGTYIGAFSGSTIQFTTGTNLVSPAAVQALVRAISFVNTSSTPDNAPRAATITLTLPDQTVLTRSVAITLDASQNIIEGDAGDNVLTGTAGDDVLRGLAGADTLQGGDGTDTTDYSGGTDAVSVDLATGVGQGGAAQGDQLTSIESVIGTSGNDQLFGDAAANRLTGGAGNDLLRGGAGGDILDGGDGVDTADYTGHAAGAGGLRGVFVSLATGIGYSAALGDYLVNIENLIGSSHQDELTGDAGVNRIEGRDGIDTIEGGGGADVLIGGTGGDWLSYRGSSGGIWIDLSTGIGQWSDAAGDTVSEFENVYGSAFDDLIVGDNGDNRLAGGDGNDEIWGGDGANFLFGEGGDDILHGGANLDSLSGGAGNDTATYAGNAMGVRIMLGRGVVTRNDGLDQTLVSSIENAVGTSFNDLMSGDVNANILSGGDGNDVFDGGGGADVLDGGSGHDIADYSLNENSKTTPGAVWVNLAVGQGFWNDAEGDVLTGIEDVRGSAFNDLLYGDAGVNFLYGGNGNDYLGGGAGADVLEGGSGQDTIDYNGSFGGIWVHLGTGQGFWNTAEGDSFTGIENVRGSWGNDLIYGDAGNNILFGNDGDDNLGGWIGADTLDGGNGTDTIDFSGDYGGVAVSLRAGVGFWNFAEGDRYIGIENVKGSIFNDFIEGNSGANVLTGAGGEDLFTFVAGFGADIITDFNGNGAASGDRIQFGAGMFTGFADLLAHSSQVGGDVRIQLDASNYLTLQGLQLGSLDASDFLF
ncbi:calcium-binding protein [Sphingomonas sp. UNC305MFCol5.2]|uniref:calcium-binding protein n=1 Tax=Sphingomonas sp. UNC305MFCol5.2 TaxID=1449076 RepID=UPI0004A78204|nr:hypothetical protein [Sphingomonas sp. UNC305MFCol5.2]